MNVDSKANSEVRSWVQVVYWVVVSGRTSELTEKVKTQEEEKAIKGVLQHGLLRSSVLLGML